MDHYPNGSSGINTYRESEAGKMAESRGVDASQNQNGSRQASPGAEEFSDAPPATSPEDLNTIKDGYKHFQRIRVVRTIISSARNMRE